MKTTNDVMTRSCTEPLRAFFTGILGTDSSSSMTPETRSFRYIK